MIWELNIELAVALNNLARDINDILGAKIFITKETSHNTREREILDTMQKNIEIIGERLDDLRMCIGVYGNESGKFLDAYKRLKEETKK